MIKLILIALLIIVFLSISIIHFYWAFGGQKWAAGAVPDAWHEGYFDPRSKTKIMMATLVIAFGFLIFIGIVASNYFNIIGPFNQEMARIGTIIIGCIFGVRAIGDFKNFGLFKKKLDTVFSQMDSRIYSPLCLVIMLACFSLAFLT